MGLYPAHFVVLGHGERESSLSFGSSRSRFRNRTALTVACAQRVRRVRLLHARFDSTGVQADVVDRLKDQLALPCSDPFDCASS